MVCPSCGASYTTDELVKVNVYGTQAVEVIYDAICPYCGIELGRMSWGNLTLREDLPAPIWQQRQDEMLRQHARRRLRARMEHRRDKQAAPPDAQDAAPEESGGEKPAPATLSTMQERPAPAEPAAKRDRRQGTDRRVKQVFRFGPERRKGERRQGNDRRTEDAPKTDRRKKNAPVLYDRRKSAADRRKDKGRDEIDWKV